MLVQPRSQPRVGLLAAHGNELCSFALAFSSRRILLLRGFWWPLPGPEGPRVQHTLPTFAAAALMPLLGWRLRIMRCNRACGAG